MIWLEPHVHVNAARAGGLGKARQLVLVEHLAHAQRDLAYLRERDIRTGVEIDAQLVGMVQVRAPHGPRVPVDHAEVDAPDEMSGVVRNELAGVPAAGEGDGRGLQPLGGAIGHALLEEGLALDAVDPALHHGRALAQVAHDGLVAVHVVVDEIHLRQAAVGEERLARVAHAHLVSADVNDGVLARLGHGWKDARS